MEYQRRRVSEVMSMTQGSLQGMVDMKRGSDIVLKRRDSPGIADGPVSHGGGAKSVNNRVAIVASIVMWYIFSVGISLYNKWMFGPNLNFSYPILITSCHQLILFFLSSAVLVSTKRFRLATHPSLPTQSLSYLLHWRVFITLILPCALASLGDIGLGNYSLKFITLSLYTMIKSSLIIFVLLWGVVFKLEKISTRIFLIVVVMAVGVIMMVYGQHDTSPAAPTPLIPLDTSVTTSKRDLALSNQVVLGSFLVLSSACMSGLRWALTQVLLKRNTHTKNPILTIFYISPSTCVTLVVIGSIVEGWQNFVGAQIWTDKGILTTLMLLAIPGVLAFCMTILEFTLLQYAPLLTLSILGIFKEVLTICISALVFGDRLNMINVLGLLMTLGDIFWYNYYRSNEQSDYEPVSTNDIELNSV